MASTAIKVSFEGETRRFPPHALPLHSLEGVRSALAGEFPSLPPAAFALRYTDEEGDVITVRTQQEWEEALNCLRSGPKIPRFALAAEGEGKGQGSRAGKAPEEDPLPPPDFLENDPLPCPDFLKAGSEKEDCPLKAFLEGIQPLAKKVEEELQKELKKQVERPQPFQPVTAYFTQRTPTPGTQSRKQTQPQQQQQSRGQRGMPFSWGPMGQGRGFFWAERANFRAVELMEAKEYEEAKALLEAAAAKCPSHASTRYNLACTHALMGATGDALSSLDRALALGFVNFPLMETDPDLQSLHGHPDFERLLDIIRPKAPAAQAEPEGESEFESDSEPEQLTFLGERPVGAGAQPEEPEQQAAAPMRAEEPAAPLPAEDPFPFAREFAEVREIGIPVEDDALRALLLTNKGDVGATMAELCTTPRG